MNFDEVADFVLSNLHNFDDDLATVTLNLVAWAKAERDEEVLQTDRIQKFKQIISIICRGMDGWPYLRGEEE